MSVNDLYYVRDSILCKIGIGQTVAHVVATYSFVSLQLTRLENHPGEHNGFYCSRRDVRGRRLYVLATMKENSSHVFKIARYLRGLCFVFSPQSKIAGLTVFWSIKVCRLVMSLFVCRPSTGVSSFDEDKQDLHNKYVPVSADKAGN